ncbi:hypothetical protein FB107DRAFT_278893 [Schizophyllum commune]
MDGYRLRLQRGGDTDERLEERERDSQPMGILSLYLTSTRQIFGRASPADLLAVRLTCRTFKAMLDGTPALWRQARANVNCTPPPPSGRTEWAWASRCFVGPLDAAVELPAHAIASYSTKWHQCNSSNITALKKFIGGALSIERVSEQLFRNYLRSPTFYRILEAFRRDLRVVDALTWKTNVWTIERELGLISLCDISRVPQGFQFFHSDHVLCPICQPNPDAFRKTVNSLPTKHQKRAYFNLNTVPAAVLEGHYRKNHMPLLLRSLDREPYEEPVPQLGIYTTCPACAARPLAERARKREVYTALGLIAHNRVFHGVVNPGQEHRWYSSSEMRPTSACLRRLPFD